MELNYDNIKESLEFLKRELNSFEKYKAPNDERNYVNRLIESYRIAIQVLEERLMCELMCGD